MAYIVIYRTATHIAHKIYKSEVAAMRDAHLNDQWCGRLFACGSPEGFTQAEAKDLYHAGVSALSPAWEIEEII